MKNNPTRSFLTTLSASIGLLAALVLSACSLPAPSTPTPQDLSAAYTTAAETIIVRLTQAAGSLTPPSPLPPSSSEVPTLPPLVSSATPTSELSPTPTTTATPNPSSSPTAPPTPTSPPDDPRASLGNPEFRDPFDDDDNWSLYEDDHVSFDVKDGKLRMRAFEAEYWDGWTLTWPEIEDFYLEMTTVTKTCSGLDRYGLMARAEKKADVGYVGYQYLISCDGQYLLRRWNGEIYVTLIDWTPTDEINPGSDQSNRIGLMADGERLSLYANGHLLAEYRDDRYKEGKFGVIVGSVNTPKFTVWVDEISYWDLP